MNDDVDMHDLRNITIIGNCLKLHMIKGSSTPKIYLQFLKSGEKMLEHQVNVLNDTFILCLPIAHNETHNISISFEPGSWDLHAYDDLNLMNEEPAVTVHDISVKLISMTEGTANVTASSSTSKHNAFMTYSFFSSSSRSKSWHNYCAIICIHYGFHNYYIANSQAM